MKDNITRSAKIPHQGENVEFKTKDSEALMYFSIAQDAGENFRLWGLTH